MKNRWLDLDKQKKPDVEDIENIEFEIDEDGVVVITSAPSVPISGTPITSLPGISDDPIIVQPPPITPSSVVFAYSENLYNWEEYWLGCSRDGVH